MENNIDEYLLQIKNLHISFHTHQGVIRAVRGIDINLKRGQILAIVGESGSGKSVTASSILQLLPKPLSQIDEGEIFYEGKNLLNLTDDEMERIRGNEISMIFQDPMTALNPTMRVGKQLVQVILKHQKITTEQAIEHAKNMLKQVGISDIARRMRQYPFELSGGLRQRLMIAMALSCNPELLLADEPTTALDVTIQAQILRIIKKLKTEMKTSIILITHDLGVVAEMADQVAVMYAGKIVETSDAINLFENPLHPYTWALIGAIPNVDTLPRTKLESIDGYPPDLMFAPQGCAFYARCPHALKVCKDYQPPTIKKENNRRVDCWLYHEQSIYHACSDIRAEVQK